MKVFEYVIVLISIVLGLAMTHLMQGVVELIQHPKRERLWWVHLLWIAHVALTSIFWWWWEFRLQLVKTWTFQIYLLVLAYAFALYLACALLIPKSLEGYDGYRDYFLSRRRWFFGTLIVVLMLDVLDTRIKGSAYFASVGLTYFGVQTLFLGVCVIGLLTPRVRVQGALAIVALTVQLLRIFWTYDTLA